MSNSGYSRKLAYKYSHFGKDTYGHDIKAFGDTTGKYFWWDASANTLYISGTLSVLGSISLADMVLADSETLTFGTGLDSIWKFDGTDMLVTKVAAAGAGLKIDADTTDTTSDVFVLDVGVNSASAAGIKETLDVGTALSGGEIARGIYIDANGKAANADTSGLYGVDVLVTATSTDRADIIGYKVLVDGSMDTADTVKGLLVDFDNTMATSTQYGIHIDASGITHTSGTLYGIYNDLSVGTGTAEFIKLAAGATGINIDGGTADRTAGNALNIDWDVNSSASSMINATIDVGTALSGGEIVRGIYFDINGVAANADTSEIHGIDVLMTAASTDRADLVAFKSSFDGSMDTADTVKGLFVDFNNTMATSTQYGIHIDASGMTHTSGNFYGNYIDISQSVASGTNFGIYESLGLSGTGIYLTGTAEKSTDSVIITSSAGRVNIDAEIDNRRRFEVFEDWKMQTLVKADTSFILDNAGGASDALINTQECGALRLITADANDRVSIICSIPMQADSGGLVFETRLKIDNVTAIQICAGLTDVNTVEVTAGVSGTTITTTLTDGCVFVYDTAATTDQWYCIGVDSDTDATGNAISGVAPVNGTYQVLRILVSTDGSTAKFYIDDAFVGATTLNSTSPNVNLYAFVALIGNADATARNLDIDYIYAGHNR